MQLLRALIVDDEPLSREDLVCHLRARDDVSVVGQCSSGVEAIGAVRRLRPDVVLLDIRMPGTDGFGVVDALEGDKTKPYVIFVTAHDEYAIDAFRVRALDYLLKPVQATRLGEALDRARERAASGSVQPPLVRYVRELMVRSGQRDVIVRTTDIDWIEADTYYARLHASGRSLLLRERMHVLEERLDPAQFARVHRSAILNLSRVTEVAHTRRGEHVAVLSTGARIPMSQQRWLQFRELIRARGVRGV